MNFFGKIFGRKPLAPRQQMIQDLLKIAAQAGLKGKYDEESFSIQFDSGGQSFLHNTWSIYEQAPPEKRRQVLADLVRSIVETRLQIPADWEQARGHVLPKLRSRSYWTLFGERLTHLSKAPPDKIRVPPHQELAEWFGVGLCYDLPSSIRDVEEDHLLKWGVSFDQALKVAVDNLAAGSAGDWGQPKQGVWESPWDDSYGCARLLLLDRIQQLKLPGQAIAAVPHRDGLLLAGSEDPQAVERLMLQSEKQAEQHHALASVPLIHEAGKWLPYQPKGELAGLACRLRTLAAAREYGEQKILLDSAYESKGQDIFVATLKVYQREDGQLFSVATWTAGVIADLPRADCIALVQVEGGQAKMIGLVDWQEAWPLLGHLMRQSYQWPVRYRVEGFPSVRELDQLPFK